MSMFLPMLSDVVARIKPASSYVDGPTQGPRRKVKAFASVRDARREVFSLEDITGFPCIVGMHPDSLIAFVLEDLWKIPADSPSLS